jgi:hypothetical protein
MLARSHSLCQIHCVSRLSVISLDPWNVHGLVSNTHISMQLPISFANTQHLSINTKAACFDRKPPDTRNDHLPSEEVVERGLGEFPPSGVVGESIACCSLLMSRCASVTLIFGNAASDIVPHSP